MKAPSSLLQGELRIRRVAVKLALGTELIQFVLLDLALQELLVVYVAHELEMTLFIALILELIKNDLHSLVLFTLFLCQETGHPTLMLSVVLQPILDYLGDFTVKLLFVLAFLHAQLSCQLSLRTVRFRGEVQPFRTVTLREHVCRHWYVLSLATREAN